MPSTPKSAPPLDFRRIRAITLDLDDTLWPVWPTIERAENALRGWLDERAPRTAALARDADAARSARRAVAAAHADRVHDLGLLRREMIRHLLRAAGDDPALAEAAFEVFHAERQRVELYADALPALAWLSARFPVVALSNGNADVHRVGIGRYFQAAISAAQIGAGKPDPRIFKAGARAAGVQPHEVLHVGDDVQLDGIGALRAGMQSAWVNRAQAPWPRDAGLAPQVVVEDLTQLCEWLGRPAHRR
ncbi:MAG: HAD family hydrolase [Ottowia sp.]|uniref:HAD family hydrolase n=1 Tax=Ottowia sp. TaxID=1898956 RepID=UPI0039E53C7D